MFIDEDSYGSENSVRSGMWEILTTMKAVASQSASHISLLTEFATRTSIHSYKHFIPSGIATRCLFDDESTG
jgi:hypothetical protein